MSRTLLSGARVLDPGAPPGPATVEIVEGVITRICPAGPDDDGLPLDGAVITPAFVEPTCTPPPPVGPWEAVRGAVAHRIPGSGLTPVQAPAAHTVGGHRAAGDTDPLAGDRCPGRRPPTRCGTARAVRACAPCRTAGCCSTPWIPLWGDLWHHVPRDRPDRARVSWVLSGVLSL